MKAFEVLDQENKGYLTTEELTKYMSEEGHNFNCCSPHYPSFSQGLALADLVVAGERPQGASSNIIRI